MKKLTVISVFLVALCLPALADGNKYGWDNPKKSPLSRRTRPHRWRRITDLSPWVWRLLACAPLSA
jgi:hypothetical protein